MVTACCRHSWLQTCCGATPAQMMDDGWYTRKSPTGASLAAQHAELVYQPLSGCQRAQWWTGLRTILIHGPLLSPWITYISWQNHRRTCGTTCDSSHLLRDGDWGGSTWGEDSRPQRLNSTRLLKLWAVYNPPGFRSIIRDLISVLRCIRSQGRMPFYCTVWVWHGTCRTPVCVILPLQQEQWQVVFPLKYGARTQ